MSATASHPRDDEGERWHIIPMNDWREHEPSCVCWCSPRPLPDCPEVLQHNALDQRELVEEGKRMIQ